MIIQTIYFQAQNQMSYFVCFTLYHHPSTCCSNMAATMDPTADLLSDPESWLSESFWLNSTAANTSDVYTPLMSPVINKTINISLIVVLTIAMVSMGCTMEVSKIKVTSGDIQ